MKRAIHVCSFEAVSIPRGRKLNYDTFCEAVLAAGRFSVFEATASRARERESA